MFMHLIPHFKIPKAEKEKIIVVQLVKNPPAMQETPAGPLGREDPLAMGYATYSSILGLPLWLHW